MREKSVGPYQSTIACTLLEIVGLPIEVLVNAATPSDSPATAARCPPAELPKSANLFGSSDRATALARR
jgi:hypothetical protein